LVDEIFLKFAVFYGHVWRSQLKDPGFIQFAKQQWCEALDRFDEAVIQKVILRYRDSEEFPPTLVQFISKCRQARDYLIPREVPSQQKITDPRIAKQMLHNLKTLLGEKSC